MSHNEINPKKGGHFFNGFLWGAILGGGLAYLLSTKKGRDLLKNLTQDGLDMLDDLTTEPEIEEVSSVSDELVEAEPVEEDKPHVSNPVQPPPAVKKPEQAVKKRFFRAGKK